MTTETKMDLFEATNERLINFLTKYGCYEREDAIDFVKSNLEQASELADKIRDSIVADKSITQEYKNSIK